MGWSINPNQLARIDNNGHVTFDYHSTDTIYTVSYSDGTCNKSKQVLVHACSTPDVCNCTITPSGSANELPAETGDTEYEIVTYSSSNCIKSAPDILYIGGTDFLGSFRNENGKTYAKVKLENTDSEVKTGRYLFMISNCRAEVEFTQMAVTPSQSCNLQRIIGSGNIIPKDGGSLKLAAVGCGGKSCFNVETIYQSGSQATYRFTPKDTPISSTVSATVTDPNGVNIENYGWGSVYVVGTSYIQVNINSEYAINGIYTLLYQDFTQNPTFVCETEFYRYVSPCSFLNLEREIPSYVHENGGTYLVAVRAQGTVTAKVTSDADWLVFDVPTSVNLMPWDRHNFYCSISPNTTGSERSCKVKLYAKANNDEEVCYEMEITQAA